MAQWYGVATPAQIERLELAWPDAPTEVPELCGFILTTAQDQVIDFAPAEAFERLVTADLPLGIPNLDRPLDRLVLAQLQQAKSIWNAGRGEVGPDGFSFTPRPLEKEIQQMIRPRRGVPNVF